MSGAQVVLQSTPPEQLSALSKAIINTSDNLLRPLIISQGARLPLILIFLGVIGGLLAWGFLGLFIGPTLLAMTYTLFLGWIEASPMPAASDVPAPGPAPPAPLA